MSRQLGGILPALVTPLQADGTLNVSALEKLLGRVYSAGVDGVYVCGSTGEGMILPASQRRNIAEIAVRSSPPGKSVVVHVGAWSFGESQALARHAEQIGASAVSALPPAGASFPELLEHYRALTAVTALPFLAYYFPAAIGHSFSLEQLEEICQIRGIVGLKFTDYDLFTMSLLARSGKLMFNGRDEVLAAGLLFGANGGIGSIYNVVPAWFTELNRNASTGHWPKARAIQDRVNDLLRVLLRFPFMSALKRVITWQGVECGQALRPRIPLTADQEKDLRYSLEPVLEIESG